MGHGDAGGSMGTEHGGRPSINTTLFKVTIGCKLRTGFGALVEQAKRGMAGGVVDSRTGEA